MITDYHEISGDRRFGDDKSMLAGFGYLGEQKVAILGIEKGRKTKEKDLSTTLECLRPEGYRKAITSYEDGFSF